MRLIAAAEKKERIKVRMAHKAKQAAVMAAKSTIVLTI
jgi:hypothetical protein